MKMPYTLQSDIPSHRTKGHDTKRLAFLRELLRTFTLTRISASAKAALIRPRANFSPLYQDLLARSHPYFIRDAKGYLIECNAAFRELLACLFSDIQCSQLLAGKIPFALAPLNEPAQKPDFKGAILHLDNIPQGGYGLSVQGDSGPVLYRLDLAHTGAHTGGPSRGQSLHPGRSDFMAGQFIPQKPGGKDFAVNDGGEGVGDKAAFQARKDSFLTSVSHELRTPLHGIIGFCEILARQSEGPLGSRKYLEYCQYIDANARHLLETIDTMLDVARLKENDLELNEDDFQMAALLQSCIDQVESFASKKGIGLRVEMVKKQALVFADRKALQRVLLNLLTNAIKFTPPGGTIEIAARPTPSGELCIQISDTGIGMDPSLIQYALDPFTQLDSTLSRRYAGTGLGLTLSQKLVEAHGGALLIDSTPGKGTRVSVRLPAHRLTPEKKPAKERPALDATL